MTAHAWEYLAPTCLLANERRWCSHCGAIQTKTQDYAWVRVVRTYWDPLAGRCKPTTPPPVYPGKPNT